MRHLPHGPRAFTRSREPWRLSAFASLRGRQYSGRVCESRRGSTEGHREFFAIGLHHRRICSRPRRASPCTKGQIEMLRRATDSPQMSSTFAVGEEAEPAGPAMIREVGKISAPLDAPGVSFQPGSTVRVDAVVRTRKIGHFFPAGTVDAFDVWLEFKAVDARATAYWRGADGWKTTGAERWTKARTFTAPNCWTRKRIPLTSATPGRHAACCTPV